MNILIITGTFPPSVNGVAISTDYLAYKILKNGHKVLVLAPENKDKNLDPKYVVRYPSITNPFIPDYPIPLFPMTASIYKRVKDFKPDLIHTQHSYHVGYLATKLAEKFKIPLVFTFHTRIDYYAKVYFKFLNKNLRQKFLTNKIMDFCKKCDLVISPSDSTKKHLIRNKINKVVTIPMIVDNLSNSGFLREDLRNDLNITKNQKVLLYVGRLSLEKNIEILIDSINLLPLDFVLVICGSGPMETILRNKVKKNGLRKRIIFVGKVNRSNLNKYYELSDYFIYPSKSETQGLIFWEALSNGLSLIVVKSSISDEWVKDEFGIASEDNATDLANSIKSIANRDYDMMSELARNFSKKYSSKDSIKKILKEYNNLINSNNLVNKLQSTGWQSWSSGRNYPKIFLERNFNPLKKEYLPNLDMEIHLKKPVYGWCSWYAYGRQITEEKIKREVDWFSKNRNIPIEYILIDEGYCRWGDWLDVNRTKFPNGMDFLKNHINKKGFKLGIWVAPFLIEKESNLFKIHPNWAVVMNKKPILGIKQSPLDKYMFERYILDIRKSEVRQFIYNTIDSLLNDGKVKLLKLDFLFCVYFIPGISASEAGSFIRDLFIYIKTKYPDVYMIACGCPLSPVVGVADSLRIGPDTVSPILESIKPIFKIFNRIRVKDVIRNIESRRWTKKYWNLDPDVFVCRNNLGFDNDRLLKLDESIKSCKGNIFLGDRMAELEEWRIKKYITPLFR